MSSLGCLRFSEAVGRARHHSREGGWGPPWHATGLGDEPRAQSQAVPRERFSLSGVFCAEAVPEEGTGPRTAPALMPWVGTHH